MNANSEKPTEGSKRRWWQSLWKKLLLALASFLFALLVLEILARIFVPIPSPIHYRDGIYANVLPMVNGYSQSGDLVGIDGPPLSVEREDGDLRIFVFGESSVAGYPWGIAGSAPAMLYDQLHGLFPERRLQVVNMGRTASFSIDAFYYLLSIERFEPDIVIFYVGYNDFFVEGTEQCFATAHPLMYGVWQWAVSHSRLLWTVRARGPAYTRGEEDPTATVEDGDPGDCDPDQAFRRWAEILVETAQSMGSHVLVTTILGNPLSVVEDVERFREVATVDERLQSLDESYRDVLRCVLTDRCDSIAEIGAFLLHNELADAPGSRFWASRATRDGQVEPEHLRQVVAQHLLSPGSMTERARVWRELSQEMDADLVDLGAELTRAAYDAYHSGGIFVDDAHLTLDGYWFLARLWTIMIARHLGLENASEVIPLDLHGTAEEHYLQELERVATAARAVLTHRGVTGPVTGEVVIAAKNLLLAESLGSETASLFLAWLRLKVGLEDAVPPDLADRVRDLDYEDFEQLDPAL